MPVHVTLGPGKPMATTMTRMRFTILVLAGGLIPAAMVGAVPPTKKLKALAFGKEPGQARALFEASRPGDGPLSADWLEAMSWVGRAGAIGGDWDLAAEYSERALQLSERLLKTQPLDQDPNAALPIALGAAIETLGKFYAEMDDRGQAITFLRGKLDAYAGTSIETRLKKNLLLLDLEGKPMPALDTDHWLNGRRFNTADLRGKVTLFFFWAHWCSDCRAQKPVLGDLEQTFGPEGFQVVAPTRLYGYVDRGRNAGPEVERAYITTAHVQKDGLLREVPVPLSAENFVAFGVSTTPTLVLVDRGGVVRLYHPGEMQRDELARRIEALL